MTNCSIRPDSPFMAMMAAHADTLHDLLRTARSVGRVPSGPKDSGSGVGLIEGLWDVAAPKLRSGGKGL